MPAATNHGMVCLLMSPSSRLPGFFKLAPEERAQQIMDFAGLSQDELATLQRGDSLSLAQADRMIENVVGVYSLPLGIATNFLVNGRDYLIPMVVEEPSVVAGLSYAARLVRQGGGFQTSSDEPVMIGQMQVLDVPDPAAARLRLLAAKEELLARATARPGHRAAGGGARDVQVRLMAEAVGVLVVRLLYDARRDGRERREHLCPRWWKADRRAGWLRIRPTWRTTDWPRGAECPAEALALEADPAKGAAPVGGVRLCRRRSGRHP